MLCLLLWRKFLRNTVLIVKLLFIFFSIYLFVVFITIYIYIYSSCTIFTKSFLLCLCCFCNKITCCFTSCSTNTQLSFHSLNKNTKQKHSFYAYGLNYKHSTGTQLFVDPCFVDYSHRPSLSKGIKPSGCQCDVVWTPL